MILKIIKNSGLLFLLRLFNEDALDKYFWSKKQIIKINKRALELQSIFKKINLGGR